MDNTQRNIITTEDGSSSIFSETFGESYHSRSGAVQESFHIYINSGLKHLISSRGVDSGHIGIFEMGFGTGLNAILTLCEVLRYNNEGHNLSVDYNTIEKYPLFYEEYSKLGYREPLQKIYGDIIDFDTAFLNLHRTEWNKSVRLTPYFTITKTDGDLFEIGDSSRFNKIYDLVYFDAFSPASQPELWSKDIFGSIFRSMSPEGALVTYSSKGIVKQALRSAGFRIERLPGPGSKRHILRAIT